MSEEHLDNPGMISMDEAFLKRLEDAIEANLENPDFGVDELGKEIGMSRSQLHRRLHDLTGKSTSRFIRSYRLGKAKSLLEGNAGIVSEVCYKTGFSSPAYFSQVFLEEFGYPPREAREKSIVRSGEKKKSKLRRATAVALSAAIIIGFGVWWLFSILSTPSEDHQKSVVVLPFADLSQDKDQEYFCDGITEDLISHLARTRGLRVISRTSSTLYRNSGKRIKDIARELQVTHVIEGSIRKSEDNIRIVVQLIDAETDAHVWADTYDRKLTETLSLQKEIADEVARQLQRQFLPAASREGGGSIVTDPLAYDLFLRGRFLAHQFTRDAYYKAIDLFEQTIEIDSGFAPAYAWLGASYLALGSWAGDLSKAQAYPKSKYYLEKALALDPNLPKAHSAQGYQKFFYEWDFKGGEEEFLKAYHLDPSDIMNISGYHHLLNMAGRFEEAKEWWKLGSQVDPFSLWNYGYMGATYYFLGEEAKAIDFYRTAVENFPYAHILYDKLGWVYLNTGQYDSAIAVLNRGFQKFGNRPPTSVSSLCLAYFKSGLVKESAALMNELLARRSAGERGICFHLSVTASGLNKTDEALNWLEQAYAAGEVEMIWVSVEPQLRMLRQDERYKKLVSAISF